MTTKEHRQLSPETRVKILMLERGYSWPDVAKGAGICVGYAQRLTNGHIVTQRGRQKIEEFFGCKIWSHEESQQSKGQMNEDDPDGLRGLTFESLEQALEAHRAKGQTLETTARALWDRLQRIGPSGELAREGEELADAMAAYFAEGKSIERKLAVLKDRFERLSIGPDGQPTDPRNFRRLLRKTPQVPDFVSQDDVKGAAALGLGFCLVCLDAWEEALQCGISIEIADEIGAQLERAGLGGYDRLILGSDAISGKPEPQAFTMVFHLRAIRAEEGVLMIRRELEALKLLKRTTIRLSQGDAWRQIYPEQPPANP